MHWLGSRPKSHIHFPCNVCKIGVLESPHADINNGPHISETTVFFTRKSLAPLFGKMWYLIEKIKVVPSFCIFSSIFQTPSGSTGV